MKMRVNFSSSRPVHTPKKKITIIMIIMKRNKQNKTVRARILILELVIRFMKIFPYFLFRFISCFGFSEVSSTCFDREPSRPSRPSLWAQ